MTPEQVIRFFGNQTKAAVALEYTRAAVSLWKIKGHIPKHAQKWIAYKTGGKLKESWKR